ncbi:MAG: ETC complex I subunit [Rhodospirillales bacterium]|nr:ETC complex I subunit [Rhodospirillales bacterium]
MARRARIYQQPKTAMQSGRAGTQEWVLAFEPDSPQQPEPLMGWISGNDTDASQVRLRFDTREEAEAFAKQRGVRYEIELPRPQRFVPKSYSDNFRFNRVGNWTH